MLYFLKAHDPHNPLTLQDDKDNDKYTHKYTNQKCLKDPSCAIFLKSMWVKDIKYDIPVCQMENNANTQIRSA